MSKTFDVNIDMFDKDIFEGYYFADNNSINYDLQNGKIETVAFCDDEERAKLICSALNLFEALQDNIEVKKQATNEKGE
jgi:hypothetical protein